MKYGPGRKDDQGKSRIDLIVPEAITLLGDVLGFGAKKYSENNWQNVDNFDNRYYAAAMRHLLAWKSGEKTDPESGLPHLGHAITCLMFLIWGEKNLDLKESKD